jgi:hypothetical protein
MNMNRILAGIGISLALLFSSEELAAQPAQDGFPGLDPQVIQQQLQQRVMGFFRDKLSVTNDAEWGVIESRLSKVIEFKMETLITGTTMPGMGFAGLGGRGGDQFLRGLLGFQPLPEADLLKKAVDNHASKAELKLALSKLLEARKEKQAKLEKAQDDLRQVLTFRQEATLSLIGILD